MTRGPILITGPTLTNMEGADTWPDSMALEMLRDRFWPAADYRVPETVLDAMLEIMRPQPRRKTYPMPVLDDVSLDERIAQLLHPKGTPQFVESSWTYSRGQLVNHQRQFGGTN